jgi:hypothetical protein
MLLFIRKWVVRINPNTFDPMVKLKLLSLKEWMARIHFPTFNPRVERYSTKNMNLVNIPRF